MKKRLICLLLALALAFSLCGAARGETVRKIGVSVGWITEANTKAFCDMLEAFFAAQETGDVKYELFFADASGNIQLQQEQINMLLRQKVDLLIISYINSAQVDETAEKIAAAGVPVVLFGREMIVREGLTYSVNESVERLLEQVRGCYVGADLRQAGLLQGEMLAARPHRGDINGDGVIRYIIIRDNSPRTESRLRTELALRAVGTAGLEAVCLADRSGAPDRETARVIAERLIQDYGPQLEAVLCTHDFIAEGAVQAIREANAGKTEENAPVNADICVLGMGGTKEAMQLIREGAIAGTVLIDEEAQNRVAQEAIMKLLNGEEVEKQYFAQYKIINSAYVMNQDRQQAN